MHFHLKNLKVVNHLRRSWFLFMRINFQLRNIYDLIRFQNESHQTDNLFYVENISGEFWVLFTKPTWKSPVIKDDSQIFNAWRNFFKDAIYQKLFFVNVSNNRKKLNSKIADTDKCTSKFIKLKLRVTCRHIYRESRLCIWTDVIVVSSIDWGLFPAPTIGRIRRGWIEFQVSIGWRHVMHVMR